LACGPSARIGNFIRLSTVEGDQGRKALLIAEMRKEWCRRRIVSDAGWHDDARAPADGEAEEFGKESIGVNVTRTCQRVAAANVAWRSCEHARRLGSTLGHIELVAAPRNVGPCQESTLQGGDQVRRRSPHQSGKVFARSPNIAAMRGDVSG
jgi:hypothetical protein